MLYYVILYRNTLYHVTVYCIKLYYNHVVIVFLPRVIAFLLDRVFCPSLLWSFTPFPTSNLLLLSFLDSTRFDFLSLCYVRSIHVCPLALALVSSISVSWLLNLNDRSAFA